MDAARDSKFRCAFNVSIVRIHKWRCGLWAERVCMAAAKIECVCRGGGGSPTSLADGLAGRQRPSLNRGDARCVNAGVHREAPDLALLERPTRGGGAGTPPVEALGSIHAPESIRRIRRRRGWRQWWRGRRGRRRRWWGRRWWCRRNTGGHPVVQVDVLSAHASTASSVPVVG